VRIGIIDYSLTNKNNFIPWKNFSLTDKAKEVPWEALYKTAKDIGFEGLELGLGQNYYDTALWESSTRSNLVGFAKKNDIATASICMHAFWFYSFASPHEATRQTAAKIAREAAVVAKETGGKNILIPLTSHKDVKNGDAKNRWISGISSCAAAAEAAGTCFCLENVGRTFMEQPEEILEIVESINSPNVKIYYDPANAVKCGWDPLKTLELFGKNISQVHVKEAGGTYLGDGTVPWKKILPALGEINYHGWLILETEPTENARFAAEKNLKWLKELI